MIQCADQSREPNHPRGRLGMTHIRLGAANNQIRVVSHAQHRSSYRTGLYRITHGRSICRCLQKLQVARRNVRVSKHRFQQ